MVTLNFARIGTALAGVLLATLTTVGCGPALDAESKPSATNTPKIPVLEIDFKTNGWTIRTSVLDPFDDRVQKDPSSVPIDDRGVAIYHQLGTGKPVDHPIVNAQYAMAALVEWEKTGKEEWLNRAIRNAQVLIDRHVERDGAWWHQYNWDWTYIDRTIVAPWWSGMAQGEALTVFSRLAEIQPHNAAWREAADATFASFFQRRSGSTKPWSTLVDNGLLWFEEYAGNQPPLLVMNGQGFAIFGLYEYYKLTGDERAALYIDGGATAILDTMPLYRVPGGPSYYCAQKDYCQQTAWQNQNYHPIHVQQLHALGRITGDARFEKWAALYESDFQLP